MSKIMGFLKYISVYKIFSLGESWGMGEGFQNVSKNFWKTTYVDHDLTPIQATSFPKYGVKYLWKT